MEDQIRNLLDEVGGLSVPAADLKPDQDLFVAGLTSFATVGVMLAIEDMFGIEIPDRLLTRDTFRSVGALKAAIAGLRDDRFVA